MKYGDVALQGALTLQGWNIPAPTGQPVGYGLSIGTNSGLVYIPLGSSYFSGSTTNVPEGTNLYFTNARAVTAVSGIGQNLALNLSGLRLYTDKANPFEVRSSAGSLKASIDSTGAPTFGSLTLPITLGTSGQTLISNGSTLGWAKTGYTRLVVDESGGADFTTLSAALAYASGIAGLTRRVNIEINGSVGWTYPITQTLDLTGNANFAYVSIDGKNGSIISNVSGSLFKISRNFNLSNVNLGYLNDAITINELISLASTKGTAINFDSSAGGASINLENVKITNFGYGLKFTRNPNLDYGGGDTYSEIMNISNLQIINCVIGMSGEANSVDTSRILNISNMVYDTSIYEAFIAGGDSVAMCMSGFKMTVSNIQIDGKKGMQIRDGRCIVTNIFGGIGYGTLTTLMESYGFAYTILNNPLLISDTIALDAYGSTINRVNASLIFNITNPIFRQNTSTAIIAGNFDSCTYNPTITNSGNIFTYGVTSTGGFKAGPVTLPSNIGNSGLVLKSDGRGGAYWG